MSGKRKRALAGSDISAVKGRCSDKYMHLQIILISCCLYRETKTCKWSQICKLVQVHGTAGSDGDANQAHPMSNGN